MIGEIFLVLELVPVLGGRSETATEIRDLFFGRPIAADEALHDSPLDLSIEAEVSGVGIRVRPRAPLAAGVLIFAGT